jgi:hypothetical protein
VSGLDKILLCRINDYDYDMESFSLSFMFILRSYHRRPFLHCLGDELLACLTVWFRVSRRIVSDTVPSSLPSSRLFFAIKIALFALLSDHVADRNIGCIRNVFVAAAVLRWALK